MAEYMNKEVFLSSMGLIGDETKYGNRDAEHQSRSYSSYMSYEIMDGVEDSIVEEELEPVKHGHWILEANKERTNYRWNVTAECSECCDVKNKIWAGFFPNVPDCIARDVALLSAESVKLSNYCPNCGAKMDLEATDEA